MPSKMYGIEKFKNLNWSHKKVERVLRNFKIFRWFHKLFSYIFGYFCTIAKSHWKLILVSLRGLISMDALKNVWNRKIQKSQLISQKSEKSSQKFQNFQMISQTIFIHFWVFFHNCKVKLKADIGLAKGPNFNGCAQKCME